MASTSSGDGRGRSLWPLLTVGLMAVAAWRTPSLQPEGPRVGGARTGETQGVGERASAGAGAAGSGHGRSATSPAAIPMRGWKDILWRVYEEINDDRVMAVAAGVTFYALLALFPTIAALVSLYGLFADPATIGSQLDSLASVMPGGAIEIIGEQIKRITANPSGSLSLALAFSLLVSLWSSNAGMKAMFDALNVVYGEKEKRSFVRLNAASLVFTLGAILFLLVALSAVVIVPVVLNLLGLGGDTGTFLLALARWPVLLLVVILGLSLLYRFGPSRARAKWRWITWGSALAGVGWLVASALFSFYVSRFGSYNATYGSLGAAIGFMTWIWISTIVILIGAEVSAEMEHQVEADTTAGSAKPLGTRGAAMADEVGHAAD